ncbi:MAG TPA: pyridoxal 5'-phosphate synthase glutaminase subunit PdxT [Thermoflexia bacterium]|jgi:5'-phosphate synthase pdxT subunit|nr:pyridoxal 5'-phosphate synthase glutaminase subunit PdxT [Thermoflexia bacterium]
MKIGVLAVQGAFIEHEQMLRRIGVEPVEVRLPEHLEGIEGLIIPGGESTTIGRVSGKWGLLEPIRDLARSGRPVWGTCAGMILMAKEVVDGVPGQPLLGLMDVTVRRNAFGRQVDSFETDLEVPALGDLPFRAVFIRAPLIERVGEEVEVLARLEDGTVVAVRQGNLLATSFHPELTEDVRFHRYFLGLSGR